jgi:hypothetical protein
VQALTSHREGSLKHLLRQILDQPRKRSKLKAELFFPLSASPHDVKSDRSFLFTQFQQQSPAGSPKWQARGKNAKARVKKDEGFLNS